MKKVALFLFALILLIGCNQSKNDTIKIGAILPLTGDYAQIGKDIQSGMLQALDDAILEGQINKGQVEILFEDGQIDTRKTVSAYNKLFEINNIQAVTTVTSKSILAIKPLVNKNKVVLINGSAISTIIEDSSDFCFSLIPNAAIESRALAAFAFENYKYHNIAIVYRNDQSGASFKDEFTKSFKELGGTISITEAHTPNTTDFRTIITKLKNIRNIDAIFMPSFGHETAMFAKQSEELNFVKQIFTYEIFNRPASINAAGSSASRVIFCSPNFNETSEEAIKLKDKIVTNFNNANYNYYLTSHYDATRLIISIIAKGAKSGVEIKNGINDLKSFTGINGTFVFNEYGAASSDIIFFTVTDGIIIPIK